jgi:hypothetical protein
MRFDTLRQVIIPATGRKSLSLFNSLYAYRGIESCRMGLHLEEGFSYISERFHFINWFSKCGFGICVRLLIYVNFK